MSYAYSWAEPAPGAHPSLSPHRARPPPLPLVPYSSLAAALEPIPAAYAPLPVSSYSSLAHALDAPAAPGPRPQVLGRRNSAVTAAAYPYPSPKTLGPPGQRSPDRAHFPIYAPPAGGRTRTARGQNHLPAPAAHPRRASSPAPPHLLAPPPPPRGPSNHVCVPQPAPSEPGPPRHAPIRFQLRDFPEPGVRVGAALARRAPAIVGGGDQVTGAADGAREMRLRIMWPGYPHHHVEKRAKTHDGRVPRDTLLLIAAQALMDLVRTLERENVRVAPGFERWAFGAGGLVGPELFVTAIHHCGGVVWQPEIWAPAR